MSSVISIVFLSPECLLFLASGFSFIKVLCYGTVCNQMFLRLSLCHHLEIYILILTDSCFCTGFCFVVYFVL